MVGKTVVSVIISLTSDNADPWSPPTEYTLIKFTDDTCILYRDDQDYDAEYGIVDDTDGGINDKVRRELGL